MARSCFDKKLLSALTIEWVGVVVFEVQPLPYGTCVHERVISEGGLGLLGATAFAAIAVSSGLGVPLLSWRSTWITVLDSTAGILDQA